MPMDGLTLGFATREMNAILPGGRIDRITQPEKDTIVLLVRAGAANHRLLLCASPNNARCHFTNLNFPNPLEPPMFCMLLRKQILSGRILSIQQMHGDRVIHVDIDTVNELGDHVLRRLVLEIMGRHSNLMLLDEDGRILEAARHVSADMSRVRQIQPGLPYLPPPAQDKIAPEDADEENLLAKLEAQGDVPLQKALAASVSGLSNPAAKELAYRVLPAGCDRADNLPETAARLAELLRRLPQMADPRVLEDEQGEPADIFPFPYLSRDLDRQKPYPTVSQALERYFGARDQQDRINQKSASMVKLLKGQIERCEKKLAQQEEDLSSAARMDEYRIMGEIINANLWQLKKGQTEATLPNFYDENGGSMTIPLDNQLTPVQNAQRYFKKYQKAREDAGDCRRAEGKDAQGAGLSGRHAAGRGQVHRRKRTGGNPAGFDAHGLHPQGRQPPPAEGAAEIEAVPLPLDGRHRHLRRQKCRAERPPDRGRAPERNVAARQGHARQPRHHPQRRGDSAPDAFGSRDSCRVVLQGAEFLRRAD